MMTASGTNIFRSFRQWTERARHRDINIKGCPKSRLTVGPPRLTTSRTCRMRRVATIRIRLCRHHPKKECENVKNKIRKNKTQLPIPAGEGKGSPWHGRDPLAC